MPVRGPLWLLPPGPDQVRGVTSPEPTKRARRDSIAEVEAPTHEGRAAKPSPIRFPWARRLDDVDVAEASLPPQVSTVVWTGHGTERAAVCPGRGVRPGRENGGSPRFPIQGMPRYAGRWGMCPKPCTPRCPSQPRDETRRAPTARPSPRAPARESSSCRSAKGWPSS